MNFSIVGLGAMLILSVSFNQALVTKDIQLGERLHGESFGKDIVEVPCGESDPDCKIRIDNPWASGSSILGSGKDSDKPNA